jgi:hypothetical protein
MPISMFSGGLAARPRNAPLLLVLLALAACSRPDTAIVSPPAPAFAPVATVQDVMLHLVDPSADALWQSVETVYSAAGEEKRQPRTPEEWAAVKRHAVTLAEAANVLLIDGRPVVAAEAPPEKMGYLGTKEIGERIAANRAEFNRFAVLLRDTATQALKAIDAQDADALLDAGGPIDAACEGCHLAFWYPGQGRPQ